MDPTETPTNREPGPSTLGRERASRDPGREPDEVTELQEHEYTLVPEEPEGARKAPREDVTVPWDRPRPMPRWATLARALLEEPALARPLDKVPPPPQRAGVPQTSSDVRPERLPVEQAVQSAATPAHELPLAREQVRDFDMLAFEQDLEALESKQATPPSVHEESTRETAVLSCTVAEWCALHEEVARAQREARDGLLRVESVQRALDDAQRQLAQRDASWAEQAASSTGTARGHAFRIAELDLQVRELERALQQAKPPAVERHVISQQPSTPATRGRKQQRPPADDLQQIRGVGPRIAARLMGLGVVSYAQIAAWTAADCTRIGEALRVGSQRIAREGWVKQARRLNARNRG